MAIADHWLSVEEIYNWIDKNGMLAHRMGSLWKFKKEEVDKWIKAGAAGCYQLAGWSERLLR